MPDPEEPEPPVEVPDDFDQADHALGWQNPQHLEEGDHD